MGQGTAIVLKGKGLRNAPPELPAGQRPGFEYFSFLNF